MTLDTARVLDAIQRALVSSSEVQAALLFLMMDHFFCSSIATST